MPNTPSTFVAVSRPMVKALFVASCLLSIVSWYTTQQGMALYLAPWFALLASLGVQTALVLVAWLVGLTKSKRGLLIAVYAITAMVSISFSYACLYTWFSARERPAVIQRKLYDSLSSAAGQSQELLASAISEGQKHVLALEEMTGAEKAHGYISRAQDADPYLAKIREAVAQEAQTYSANYPEGTGQGLRYTAFDRYAKMARQSLERLQTAQQSLADFRKNLKPLDPTDTQLRNFQQVFNAVPWQEVQDTLHANNFALPAVPAYSNFVDRSASGQEDLLIAFQELVSAPGGRHIFAFALAAFIDLIVFLLAFSSGPYFWRARGALGRRRCAVGFQRRSGVHSELAAQAGTGPARDGACGGGRIKLRRAAIVPPARLERSRSAGTRRWETLLSARQGHSRTIGGVACQSPNLTARLRETRLRSGPALKMAIPKIPPELQTSGSGSNGA